VTPEGRARDGKREAVWVVRRSVFTMAARSGPTDADRSKAMEIALQGLANADELGEIAARLAPLHPRHDTFPAEVLLDLAADAIDVSGANRQSPIHFEDVRQRYLLDGTAHTRAEHHKSAFALRAAAMLHGGVDPGLLDEVQWWQTDDVWYWSLKALVCLRPGRCRPRRGAGGVHLSSARRRSRCHARWRRHSVTATNPHGHARFSPRRTLRRDAVQLRRMRSVASRSVCVFGAQVPDGALGCRTQPERARSKCHSDAPGRRRPPHEGGS
jgi:hypothetical protein